MLKEFMITEDGSHTIYLPEIDEHYHSVHGAIQESQHIYINQGLLQVQKKEINILEIGFGTGLNAYLTYCNTHDKTWVNYFCLEKYPLNEAEFSKLNYTESLFPENQNIFMFMHQAVWNTPVSISTHFNLIKLQADLLEFKFDSLPQFDLVYYDAFAPVKQPEMWTDGLLETVAASVKKDGIFITYCAKGSVRRALTNAGFLMERIPGPVGKKEILRGKKTI